MRGIWEGPGKTEVTPRDGGGTEAEVAENHSKHGPSPGACV